MIAEIASDPELQQRLVHDCAEHTRTISSLLSALREELVEDELAFRHCALELHSVKGVASVLGLGPVLTAIGPLCEVMLRGNPRFGRDFFDAFEGWFTGLVACMERAAFGHEDAAALEQARRGQSTLLALLTPRPKRLERPAPLSALKVSPSSGRRLLVVDDSATVCAALSAQLRDRGYPVRCARNLGESAEALRSFGPEIVISDVHMPDVEGDELCRRIKAQMTRIVPVVLYSVMPTEQLAELARAAGADAYVHKGLGVEALVARMDELLSDEILF